MNTTSQKLTVYDFGRRLLQTNDLDPVYVLLWEAHLDADELYRWLLSYWCFYHMGTASWCTEGDYWSRMLEAAGSKDYPRCHERRHFRGQKAVDAINRLSQMRVSSLFQPLVGVGSQSVHLVMTKVQSWPQFGPWIAFKVADMLERLGLCNVRFDAGAMFLFDSPREGAELLYSQEAMFHGELKTNRGEWAVGRILSELGQHEAPPRYERKINVQEAETILCKWKSYMGGRYHVGEDVASCRAGLLRFARCFLSQRLLQAGKRGGLW